MMGVERVRCSLSGFAAGMGGEMGAAGRETGGSTYCPHFEFISGAFVPGREERKVKETYSIPPLRNQPPPLVPLYLPPPQTPPPSKILNLNP